MKEGYVIQKQIRCRNCTDGKFGVFPEGYPEQLQMYLCQHCGGQGFRFENVLVNATTINGHIVLTLTEDATTR